MNLLFNCFEGSNEEKSGQATEGRGSMVKCVETTFEGEELVKILWGVPCMTVLWKLFNTCG